ncbi:quinol:cytochrome C oxidoreductase [Rapidithrix thailandica]|uniref:Quinol:cytochrome C oxidoreductase n=1 Tax=Rapidithrix thailandica TaxID=413964 RepID=A0AAW9RPU7_9BACT
MSHEIKNVEEYFQISPKLKKNLAIILGIGLVLFVIGLFQVSSSGGEHHGDHHGELINAASTASVQGAAAVEAEGHGFHWIQRLYANLWINNIYFIGIAIIGVFFFAIQYIANAGWSVVLLRIMSALSTFLPIAAVLMIVTFFFANHDLFHWTHEGIADPASDNYDAIIAGKVGFLNLPFYWSRLIIFLGVWILFAWMLRKQSGKEESIGGVKLYKNTTKLSGAFLIFFGISSSVAAWDWIMSIDTHWYSTMFGWYVFASWFVSGLAAITLIAVLLKDAGFMKVLNENHLHDMGKFVFGFSIFWTYIWFSQFLLIYYANIPEETVYFWERLNSDYYSKFIFINLFLNFFFPFLGLMTRDAKRKIILLKIVCVIVLIGHWLDFYLMVTPGTLKGHGNFGFLEIGLTMIYLAVFAFVVANALTKLPLIPKKHPMLEESLHHHT